jgi:hypothetical protein
MPESELTVRGEGTLATIKSSLDECRKIVHHAEFEWALRHYEHARSVVERARDRFVALQHCLGLPQFADYELDLFRFQASQLDRAISSIENALAHLSRSAMAAGG